MNLARVGPVQDKAVQGRPAINKNYLKKEFFLPVRLVCTIDEP